MNNFKYCFFLILLGFITCSLPKNIATEEATEQVVIDDNILVLETYLWRDFMPIAPPNGRNLIGQLLIQRPDKGPFTPHFEIAGVYVYDDEEWLWSVKPENRRPEMNNNNQVEVIVRDGPKLDTDLKVDVIVVLQYRDTKYLLKAEDQTIHRTY